MTDFEDTVAKIMKQTGLSRDQVYALVLKKYNEHGIITIEGAAQMVGMELGVDG